MTGYVGPYDGRSDATDYEAQVFVIRQILSQIATTTLVKVIAVTNAGGLAPVGLIDVQPLVSQVDGQGVAMAHGILHNVPYVRLQGGANAIILDPQIGDLGFVGFCSTDISAAKSTKGLSNPGSSRRFDWADGVYLGGVLNGVPTQYIQFNGANLSIVSAGTITITAPVVNVTGVLQVGGVTVTVP